jgi:hypothetical protein
MPVAMALNCFPAEVRPSRASRVRSRALRPRPFPTWAVTEG